ncbi:MAG: cytochrome c [Epsilonproteobacteria bacterium]|nr:cytochrome c [Campylobacterota bacterium]
MGRTLTLGIVISLALLSGCSAQSAQKVTGVAERSTAAPSSRGEVLFKQNCAVCHVTRRPADRSKLVAPPIAGVMFHVKERYPKREDAVAFIVDYVRNPSHAKALCPSVKRFGLMPRLQLPRKELEEIANYLFDNYPPQGFRHGRGMGRGRGGRGMGMGMGEGMQGQ